MHELCLLTRKSIEGLRSISAEAVSFCPTDFANQHLMENFEMFEMFGAQLQFRRAGQLKPKRF